MTWAAWCLAVLAGETKEEWLREKTKLSTAMLLVGHTGKAQPGSLSPLLGMADKSQNPIPI